MKMPSSNVGTLIPDDEDLKNIHENEDEKSLRIKHENDKFFSRLLSKETSKSNPSFRVLYYGDVSSAVPFTWETRPGTPKHHPSAFGQNNSSYDDIHIPPPLTPPPSYYTSHDHHLYQLYRNSSNNKKNYSSSRSKLLHTLLRRINPKKSHPIPASSPSSYSSSSASSTCSFSSHRSSFSSDPFIGKPYSNGAHRRSRSCLADMRRSSTTVTLDEEFCSPSRLCLGNIGKDNRQRLHSAFILKKAFFSIIGRGST